MKKKRKKITTEKGKKDHFLSEQLGGEQRQLCGEQSDLKNAHLKAPASVSSPAAATAPPSADIPCADMGARELRLL